MLDLVIDEINKDRKRVIRFIDVNVKPKEGIYLKVDIDNSFDDKSFSNYLIVDKNTDRFATAFVSEGCSKKDELREYIAERDAMSKLLNLDANKAIDTPAKKILSTVYKCLTINADTATLSGKKELDTLGGLINHICNVGLGFYKDIQDKVSVALNLKQNGEYCKQIVKALEYAKNEARLAEIDAIERYIKENLGAIINFANKIGIPTNGVLKVFFTSSLGRIDDSREAYKREEDFYLYRGILNADGIQIIDGELKGTTIYGFNNNSKKTGIKPLCMNIELTKYLTIEEAMDYRIAYQLLETISVNNSARAFGISVTSLDLQFATDAEEAINKNINIDDFTKKVDEKGLIFRLHYKDKNIINATTNTFVSNTKRFVANKKINLKNFLTDYKCDFTVDKESAKDTTVTIDDPSILQLLARVGFCWSKNLNLYSDFGAYGIGNQSGSHNLAGEMEVIYTKYKNILDAFLRSSHPDVVITNRVINDYTSECINAYINNMHNTENSLIMLTRLLNYKLNLVNEFKIEGNGLVMVDMAGKIREKLEKAVDEGVELKFENEAEYFYTLGQLAFYVEYQVQKNLDLSPFKEYTNKRTAKDMVNHLITRLDLYGYSINPSNKAIRAIASKIFLTGGVTGKVRDNLDFFYGGVTSSNVFLRKKEKSNKENDM